MITENQSAVGSRTKKRRSNGLKYQTWSGIRPGALLSGIGLITVGIAGVVLAPKAGEFLYQNHDRLPGALQDEIYPELYSLETYEAEFFNWALWPASALIFLGLLLLTYSFLPRPLRERLSSRNGEFGLWAIAAVGIAFRARALLEKRSLWIDESVVAANLQERGLLDLLATPLDFGQSAPPGFLLLTWVSYTLFGASEVALRLTPFLFGVATVVLAKFSSTKLFRSTTARVTFVGIVSFSPVLVYYSQELKQYSIDAFATVIAIWMLANWGAQRNTWLFGLIGALLVQFSLTSVLVLSALGVAILIRYVQQVGPWSGIKSMLRKHFRVFALWLAGGLIHGWYLVVAGADREALRNLWLSEGGFPPQEGSVIGPWLIESFQKLAWLTLGHNSVASVTVNTPEILTVVVLVLVGFGLAVSSRGRIFSVALLASTLVLGFLQIYPYFVGRLNLYLVPLIALILAGLAERLSVLPSRPAAWLSSRFVAGTVLVPLFISLVIFGRPEDKHDMRWLIAEYELRHKFGEILTTPDKPIYGWYESALELNHPYYIDHKTIIDNPEVVSLETVWIISTHSSASPIIEALSESHRLECEASLRFTTLQVLKPLAAPQSGESFCQIRVPKL